MKKKDNKKNISKITITLQLLLTLVIIVFVILYFIDHKYISFLELFLSLDFIFMGINNYLVYKRKNVTPLYILFAVITFIMSIWGFING